MVNSLIEKEVGSELLLYDPDLDEVYILNATARLVYKLHKEGKNLAEIEQQMKGFFRVEEGVNLFGDLQQCLAKLRTKGLIE